MWAYFTVALLAQGQCKLEDDKFCDFENKYCHFNSSELRNADHHSSFSTLLGRPLATSRENKGCKLPNADEVFQIGIDPCYADQSVPVPEDADFCPDPGDNFYKDNGRRVLVSDNDTGLHDFTDAYISGDPIEFHILSIGRHYIYGFSPEEHGPSTNANEYSKGINLKDLVFRTLPLNSQDFQSLNFKMSNMTLPTGNQCPLEIRFADDRTIHMDLKQQYENIYVMSSQYYSELHKEALHSGRGCYMCYKMNGKNDTDVSFFYLILLSSAHVFFLGY